MAIILPPEPRFLIASEQSFQEPLLYASELAVVDDILGIQINSILGSMDPFRVAATKRRIEWEMTARPEQLLPEDMMALYDVWLLLTGRGWGKTHVGASITGLFGLENPETRIGIIAPTAADVRDTCFEGVSGLLEFIPEVCFRGGSRETGYNRSLAECFLANGTIFKGFAATEPERLRGPQHHFVWGDEIAVWKQLEMAMDNMYFGLRLGKSPKALFTTTPRPMKYLRELRDDKGTFVTTGSTYDNIENISERAVKKMEEKYGGTRLGRQELQGELLEDVVGALWSQVMINACRLSQEDMVHRELTRIVVGVDPAAKSGPNSAETGIVVDGKDNTGHGYVLEDASLRGKPEEWASVAVRMFYKHSADCIVAEVNNGGDMVEAVIKAVDPNVPVKQVHATRGKTKRAEPISLMAEQGKWHHVGPHKDFVKLEDQMCRFVPGEIEEDDSPDRVDAHVWAGTELFFGTNQKTGGKVTVSSF